MAALALFDLRYTEIQKSIVAMLIVVTAVVATPVLVSKKLKEPAFAAGKCELLWKYDDEQYFHGAAEFRSDGSYEHRIGTDIYVGTWHVKDGKLHVREHRDASDHWLDWWVSLPSGVGETDQGTRVEIWRKP